MGAVCYKCTKNKIKSNIQTNTGCKQIIENSEIITSIKDKVDVE